MRQTRGHREVLDETDTNPITIELSVHHHVHGHEQNPTVLSGGGYFTLQKRSAIKEGMLACITDVVQSKSKET